MQDARYWRGRAVLCLDLARRLSDPRAADKLRSDAATSFAKATELEAESPASSADARTSVGSTGKLQTS
jgi:hypothetical protein